MIKKLVIFILIALGLFYIVSGIYFYHKSFRKKDSVVTNEIDTTFKFNVSDLIVMKDILIDFDDDGNESRFSLSSDFSHSGKKSVKLTPETEFGAEIRESFSEIPALTQLRQVEITLKIRNSKVNEEGILWILEINSEDGKVLHWHPEDLPTTLNKWESYTFRFDIIPEFLKNFNRIKTYAWNRSKNKSYIDDVRIRFWGLPQENNSIAINSVNQSSFYFDLENDSLLENIESLSDDFSRSGKRSSFINGKNEVSVTVVKSFGDVMNDTIKTIYASAWLYPITDRPECTLVAEIRNSDDEQIYWNGKSTSKMNLKAGSWQKLNAAFNIAPEDYRKFTKDDRIYIYVLNNTRSKIYADDFEISYGNTPERSGNQIFVDMNTLDGRTYQFNRYHPPYPISYLNKNEINNSNSSYLVKTDTFHYGALLPDQYFATGNFSGNTSGNEELLAFTGNAIEIYHYCENKKRFTVTGISTVFKNDFSKSLINAGDFNGDGKTDLLVTRGSVSKLYSFVNSQSRSCSDNLQEIQMNLLWTGNVSSAITKLFTGNFSGLKNDELFISEKNGHCTIKRFDGKNWNVLAGDSVSKNAFGEKSTQVCGKYFSAKNDVLFSIYQDHNHTRSACFALMNGKIKNIPIPDQEMLDNFFSVDDILYKLPSNDSHYDNILAFNNRWRFELKLISIDNKGFYISSIPEFKGYANDQNPKYYEFPKLIPGKFNGNKTGLLCILRNCADNNFDGYYCKKYDSIPDLPNSVQLYNFSK